MISLTEKQKAGRVSERLTLERVRRQKISGGIRSVSLLYSSSISRLTEQVRQLQIENVARRPEKK
jgi:hypothetical protein